VSPSAVRIISTEGGILFFQWLVPSKQYPRFRSICQSASFDGVTQQRFETFLDGFAPGAATRASLGSYLGRKLGTFAIATAFRHRVPRPFPNFQVTIANMNSQPQTAHSGRFCSLGSAVR
jgi:hypothetical protein